MDSQVNVRNFMFLYFWLQFISFYTFHPSSEYEREVKFVGILSLLILTFCGAEFNRIRGLYIIEPVPDYGYFKFVVAASLCIAYHLYRFQSTTRFLVVLLTCVFLTFLYGSYFNSNDVKNEHALEDQSLLSHLFPTDQQMKRVLLLNY